MKRRFSYSDQKSSRHRLGWVILGVVVFFLLYTSFTSLFFSMRVIENNTMAPNLRVGDMLIFSSSNIQNIIPFLNTGKQTFHRGSIVLADISGGEKPGFFKTLADWAIRFFTAQRLSITERDENIFVKRIIGLPGDEVTMTNFVIRVKVKGSAYSLTEFEVSSQDYTTDIPQMPALWDSSLPFSGTMDTVVLGANEFFVLSDDRSSTNDSRTWGPVPLRDIAGKALFRYWPANRMGRP